MKRSSDSSAPKHVRSSAGRNGQAGSRKRPWRVAGRLALMIVAPLALLAVLEAGLLLGSYGHDPRFLIPGPLEGTRVPNPRYTWSLFGPRAARAPLPSVVRLVRKPNSYRIFVLGASAALGDPDASVSFARVLEAMLVQRFPGVHFEVINAAVTAINSHTVRTIARECADYEPDLFIVYLGNNEVIGPYGIGKGAGLPRGMIRAGIWLRRRRTGQLLGELARGTGRTVVGEDKRWGGMRMFLEQRAPADDPRLARIYRQYEGNLTDICAGGQTAGADVLLCTVLTNLKDCSPFRSGHRPDLSAKDLQRWTVAWERGRRQQAAGDIDEALASFGEAASIDNRYAELQYRLGRCHLALGHPAAARRHLVLARDLDQLRFRADTRINDVIRAVAHKNELRGVHLVDVEQAATALPSPSGPIAGKELLYEHVHLNFAGNYAVASLLFPPVAARVAAGFGDAPASDAPPSPKACARWLVYTAFNRFQAAKSLAARMSRPPFKPEHGRHAAIEMRRWLSQLTPRMLDEIVGQARAALSERPDDLLLRSNYANVLYVTHDNPGAIREYRALLSRYPYDSDWRYFLGDAIAAEGRLDKAEPWLRAALRLAPSNVDARCAMGRLLSETGRRAAAIEEYEKAVAIDPGSTQARDALDKLRRQRQDHRRATTVN